jgi:cellulose synthase/poly-beta-1,6-N-acetylglucosamine synthase-like glycosyltransferase
MRRRVPVRSVLRHLLPSQVFLPVPPVDPRSHSLSRALARSSSRLNPPPTPWRSVAIHGAVFTVWAVLFSMAFMRGGLLAWSVGAAYVAYDTLLQAFVLWHTRRLLHPPVAGATGPAATATVTAQCSLGVIIAAHNEATVLPATLAALLAQDSAAEQIVIADDGSSDHTIDLLTGRYGLELPALGMLSAPSPDYPTLRWLRLPHGGKARALNAAMLTMDTDTVLTVDADTLLDVRALGAVRRAFAAEAELVAVTGVITPVCDATPLGRVLQWFQTYEYIRNFLSRHAWMQVHSLLLISGAFAGFRRRALLAVGGFDPVCLVEDYELIHRLRRHAQTHGLDWRCRVLGDAQAHTEAPGTVVAFLKQRRRWFGGFLQTQYWYRAMVGDARLGWLGLWMLPVKAIDTLQPLYGLTAFGLLVVYAATGRLDIVVPASAVIAGKIGIDLAFHLWSVHLYRRWVGDAARASMGWALVAALVEPFTFQLLRHTGAALGWVVFLTGQRQWGRQSRFGLTR